jgi:predicted DNA-binding transcriptional regulator AlpA
MTMIAADLVPFTSSGPMLDSTSPRSKNAPRTLEGPPLVKALPAPSRKPPRSVGRPDSLEAIESGHSSTDLATQIERHRGALTVTELTAIVGLSKQFIYGLIARGAIPSNNVAGVIRLDPKSTAKWWRSTAA